MENLLDNPPQACSENTATAKDTAISHHTLIRKTGVILVTLAVMCLGLEGLARVHHVLSKPLYGHSINFDQKYALATYQPSKIKQKPVLLILGNSRVDRGIYAEQLSHSLRRQGKKLTVLNLGVRGSDLHMSLFLLKQAVHSGLKPKWIVIGLDPSIIYPSRNSDKSAILDTYVGKCFIYPPKGLWDKIDCQLATTFYLYRNRVALKNSLSHLPQQLLRPDHEFLRHHTISPMSPRGWSPGFGNLDPAQPLKQQKEELDTSEELLTQLLQYAKKEGIQPVLVWTPLYPHRTQTQDGIQRLKHSLEKTGRISRKFNVPCINMMALIPHENHFQDGGHLNAVGAVKFTQALAEKLNNPIFESFWNGQPKHQLAGSSKE